MVTLTFADRMQKRLLRPIVPKVLKFPAPQTYWEDVVPTSPKDWRHAIKQPSWSDLTHFRITETLRFIFYNERINYKLLSACHRLQSSQFSLLNLPNLFQFNPLETLVPPLLSPFLDHPHLL